MAESYHYVRTTAALSFSLTLPTWVRITLKIKISHIMPEALFLEKTLKSHLCGLFVIRSLK